MPQVRLNPTESGQSGRIVGELEAGEDQAAVVHALCAAPRIVLEEGAHLMVHGEDRVQVPPESLDADRDRKREEIRRGRAKRFVFRLDTKAGPRVIKISEAVSLGNQLSGLWTSVSRREHRFHARTQSLGLAAAHTQGYLEWRVGPALRRALQVQSFVPDGMEMLETFLARELDSFGDAALDPLADALAAMHGAPFFHADLKGFHAYVHDVRRTSAASEYTLSWIDLARVSFHMTPRKRIINLYQALRFVVPNRPEAHERFVLRYCRTSGYGAQKPERVLAKVRAFLAHKYRTHPNP